jgi:hypothetical protein
MYVSTIFITWGFKVTPLKKNDDYTKEDLKIYHSIGFYFVIYTYDLKAL